MISPGEERPAPIKATPARAGAADLDPSDRLTNLGPSPTRFVGRGQDLTRLAGLYVDGARLVTLLGPPGVGKTRLAQRYGALHLADYPGGVWFCDLTAAEDLDGIVAALAKALSVPAEGVTQLGYVLSARGELLLIMDHFEGGGKARQDIA